MNDEKKEIKFITTVDEEILDLIFRLYDKTFKELVDR